ncbi:hypothetical protein Bca4012_064735 [Brassica carinata]
MSSASSHRPQTDGYDRGVRPAGNKYDQKDYPRQDNRKANDRVMIKPLSSRGDKPTQFDKPYRYNPYSRGQDRQQLMKEEKSQMRQQQDHTSAPMWRKKQETLKITEHKELSPAKVQEDVIQHHDKQQTPLTLSRAELEISKAFPDVPRDSYVTFRSGNGNTSELQPDALAIETLKEDDFDETMADANGNELMAMEEDDLLGEELERLHPLVEEHGNSKLGMDINDEKVTTMVVYESQDVEKDVTGSVSKPGSVTRALFPTGDARQIQAPCFSTVQKQCNGS